MTPTPLAIMGIILALLCILRERQLLKRERNLDQKQASLDAEIQHWIEQRRMLDNTLAEIDEHRKRLHTIEEMDDLYATVLKGTPGLDRIHMPIGDDGWYSTMFGKN